LRAASCGANASLAMIELREFGATTNTSRASNPRRARDVAPRKDAPSGRRRRRVERRSDHERNRGGLESHHVEAE